MAGTTFPGGVTAGPAGQSAIATLRGVPAQGTFRLSGNVVDTQTMTIGGRVFRVAVVNTNTGQVTSGGELNNTREKVLLTVASHGRVKGDLVRVENEIMRVLHVQSPARLLLKRGVCGTTVAAHADAQSIFVEATSGTAGIPVGMVTTLTPAVFSPRFVATFNEMCNLPLVALSPEDSLIVILSADKPGGDPFPRADTYALAETFTNGAWDAASMSGGQVPGHLMVREVLFSSADVTAGYKYVFFPFVPTIEWFLLQTISTQALVAWTGTTSVVGNAVKLTNGGGTPYATTHRMILCVGGA